MSIAFESSLIVMIALHYDLVPFPVNRENCTTTVESNETANSKHWVSLPSDIMDGKSLL